MTEQDLLKLLDIKPEDYNRIIIKTYSKELDNVDDLTLRCLALDIFLRLDNINSATLNMIMKTPQVFAINIVKPIMNLLTIVLYCSDVLTIECEDDIKRIIMAHYNCLKQIIENSIDKEEQIKKIYSVTDMIYEIESLVDQFVFDDEDEEIFRKSANIINKENTTIH